MAKSFKNFLERYCATLCETNTTSIRTFANKLQDYPRLKEPLLLLALAQGREDYLVVSVGNTALEQCYKEWNLSYKTSGKGLCDYLDSLDDGDRYKKCYLSWVADCGTLERDRELLVKVSVRINKLIEQRGLTRAEACRVTGLNKGNFYAFLKGNTAKLSRKTAIAAYDKLERAAL